MSHKIINLNDYERITINFDKGCVAIAKDKRGNAVVMTRAATLGYTLDVSRPSHFVTVAQITERDKEEDDGK